mgnify:FL=1
MGKGTQASKILRPLGQGTQYYLGKGLHTLGVLGWALRQMGRSEVYVSTFSTSEAFLSGFLGLRRKGLVERAVLLADLKASRKTRELYRLMSRCFDDVYLGQNHSKVVLIRSMSGDTLSVITSQNQTYGDRCEATMVTGDKEAYARLMEGFKEMVNDNSILVDGLFDRLIARDRGQGDGDDVAR